MENKNIVLQTTDKGLVAEQIVNPSVNVNFNSGAVSINGQLSTLSIMEKEILTNLPMAQYNTILSEVDNQVLAASDEDKKLLEAKKAIFQKLYDDVVKSTETAVKAIYKLYNK